jgi:hypothetical protein
MPGAGVDPSSGLGGDVPTDATAGAFPFTNVTDTHLARLEVYATVAGTLILYDRLLHNSGISATSTGAQTLNTVALTRPDANGADVEAWWQVYVVMGAGTPTITLSYTDQVGNAGAAATAVMVTTSAANRTGPFALASGDTGVRSVQTWTNSATMSSGTIGLVLRRQVATAGFPFANAAISLDAIRLGLPRVYDDACLELVWLASSTTSNTVAGALKLAQG